MKLVRDKVPALFPDQHTYRPGTKTEVEWLLRLKLAEECGEVLSAPTRPALVSELADLAEVMDALMARTGISAGELLEAKAAKRDSRGGFEEGWVLE